MTGFARIAASVRMSSKLWKNNSVVWIKVF